MRTNKLINGLALLGALIVMVGVSSAANQAFAAGTDAGLNSSLETLHTKQ